MTLVMAGLVALLVLRFLLGVAHRRMTAEHAEQRQYESTRDALHRIARSRSGGRL